MKNQTTANVHSMSDKTSISPELTRALRAAVRSSKVENVLFSAGATKFRGTPAEVLEEVAVAQTAAWIRGSGSLPQGMAPTSSAAPSKVLAAAAETINEQALIEAAGIVGAQGSTDLDTIRAYLTTAMALTAVEASRFAAAEERPVCHNCVAIGGIAVARAVIAPAFASSPGAGR